MISGVVLHSLPAGYRFDLRRRERVATPTLHALPGGEAASKLVEKLVPADNVGRRMSEPHRTEDGS